MGLIVVVAAAGAVVGGLVATSGGGLNLAAETIVQGQLHAESGPFLTDSHGRVVVLRGVNAVYKRAPFELYADPGKDWNFSQEDAERMAALGFNVVRLGVIWEGLEPGTLGPNNPAICSPGPAHDPHQFNAAVTSAYLAKVAKTVALLGKYHIYTLLDMHEDVYSSEFGGEGAPPWAVCTDSYPIGTLPGRWSNTYNDPGLITATKHFWTNDVVGDLQGEYIRVWKAVAHYFRDDPWVVGYDPINQPFTKTLRAGVPEVAARLECLYTGAAYPGESSFDGSVLACPPDDPKIGLIRTLQATSPHQLVFFEPDIFSSSGHPNTIGSMGLPGLVFNFHDYCGFRSGVTGNPTDLNVCSAQELRTMQRRSEERPDIASSEQPLGPAWFMSEFGATTSDALDGAADGKCRQSAPRLDVLGVEVLRRPDGKFGRGIGTGERQIVPRQSVGLAAVPASGVRYTDLVLVRSRQRALPHALRAEPEGDGSDRHFCTPVGALSEWISGLSDRRNGAFAPRRHSFGRGE